MLLRRGGEAARRKEYTQHLVEHLDLLLTELAAERQRFAAPPQPPGTPGSEAHTGRTDAAGSPGQPYTRKSRTTMPRCAGWVDVDVRSLCSSCARKQQQSLTVQRGWSAELYSRC